MNKSLKVLLVTASARGEDSLTRQLAQEQLEQLQKHYNSIDVTQRDVAKGLPLIDAAWIAANYTPAQQRTPEQEAILALSNKLVAELAQADLVLLAAPIYNFSVPASLKAWIDLVARVGLTFKYTEQGPLGLLQNKKAYVMMASGGTQLGSAIDFASGYLRHVLGFIGIQDVAFVDAARLQMDDHERLHAIRQQMTRLAQQAA